MGIDFQSPNGQPGQKAEGVSNILSGVLQLALLPEQYRLSRIQQKDFKRNRKQILQQAAAESAEVLGQATTLESTQRASYGASGLEQQGTPGLISLDSLLQGLVEARRVQGAGLRRAKGLRAAGQEAKRASAGAGAFEGGGKILIGSIQAAGG